MKTETHIDFCQTWWLLSYKRELLKQQCEQSICIGICPHRTVKIDQIIIVQTYHVTIFQTNIFYKPWRSAKWISYCKHFALKFYNNTSVTKSNQEHALCEFSQRGWRSETFHSRPNLYKIMNLYRFLLNLNSIACLCWAETWAYRHYIQISGSVKCFLVVRRGESIYSVLFYMEVHEKVSNLSEANLIE